MKGIDKKALQKASIVIKVIKHPLRLKIMDYILTNQSVHVTKIYKKLKLEQSVTSSHLALLRNAGFLNIKRGGKRIYYSINVKKADRVMKAINMYA